MRILIAPDKFKGSLSALQAARAIARGWRRIRPRDALHLLPISDGGDGFGEVLSQSLGARPLSLRTVDAAHRPLRAQWWWHEPSRTAIIESARIIGLALLPPGQFHPRQLDTFGLGAAIRAAAEKGTRRCIIGIGGSATNDAGFGLARALDWQFLDRHGQPLESWPELAKLHRIVPPRRRRWFKQLIVAVDVQNRLLGVRGCTRIYGPQKGLTPEDFGPAERALRRLATVAGRQLGLACHRLPGSGAAGGLGFGLMTFLGAQAAPGFALFARHAGLPRLLRQMQLVITGEGALDPSSLMGKGVGELARLCRQHQVPCLALAGVVKPSDHWKKWFAFTGGLTDLTNPDDAKKNAAPCLEELAARAANHFSNGRA